MFECGRNPGLKETSATFDVVISRRSDTLGKYIYNPVHRYLALMVGLIQSIDGVNLAFRAGRSWREHMYARFDLSTGSSLDIYNPPTIEAKNERPPGIEYPPANEHD